MSKCSIDTYSKVFEEKNCVEFDFNKYAQSCIFFLLCDSHVVYIGATTRGLTGVALAKDALQKRWDIYPDSTMIMQVDANNADQILTHYLLKYNPSYNDRVPKDGAYTINTVKKKLLQDFGVSLNRAAVVKLLNKYLIQQHYFSMRYYIKKSQYELLLFKMRSELM